MKLTEQLGPLRKAITRYFNIAELKALCFDLGIDYQELAGDTKTEKVTSLLGFCERHGRLPDILTYLQSERPKIDWTAYHVDKTTIVTPPFKGLQHFESADAHLFFGREALTAELVGRLRRDNFLAIIGASGSGKSSLVRAGLIPALAAGQSLANGIEPPAGSNSWPVRIITPSAQPLKELAASLTDDDPALSTTLTLMDDLARDSRSLDLAVSKLLVQRGQGNRFLLVVDQFEELFTVCTNEAARRAFIDNLMTAVAPETGGPTIVVITLRADFYDRCHPYPELRAVLETGQKFIGAMTRDEMHRAIEQPAILNGYTFEPGLVELILEDMKADRDNLPDPGTLPLLSHALKETWRRRDGRLLTLQGYTAAGRVQGAIAQTAEAEFNLLLPEERVLARNLFLRLIDLSERTEPTRRQANRQELLPHGATASAVSEVLTDLTDARLLTIDQNEQGEEVVNIVHEALMWRWPRLQKWLEEDRERIILRHRLTDAARDWAQHDREASYLYYGSRLKQIEEQFVETELNAQEQAFVAASRKAEHQSLRRRNWLFAGLAGLLVTFGVLVFVLFQMQRSPWQLTYAANPVFQLVAGSYDPPLYYMGTRDLGVGWTTDGVQWMVSQTGLPLGSSGEFARSVRRLAAERMKPRHLLAYIFENGVYESFDAGDTWHEVNGEMDGQLPAVDLIDLAVWDNWFLAVTERGMPNDLYVSQDGGQHWRPAQELACPDAGGEVVQPEGIMAVYFSADGATVYAGASDGLYHTQRVPCWSWQRLVETPPVFLIEGNLAADELLFLETLDPEAAANSRVYRWPAANGEALLTTLQQNEPIALAPHPNPEAAVAVYALLVNGEVQAVSRDGTVREMAQVSGLALDLLAVPDPAGGGVQLWLAHEDGLLALTDNGR